MSFLWFCKVQLFFFRIHEWEQPDSRFGMSKIRCHFFVFARFNIFLSKFMCGSVRNQTLLLFPLNFRSICFFNLRCFGAFVVFLEVKHILGLKDHITINIVCYTTKFFSALVSLACFHITAARINIVILALNICSRFRNQILESMLS